MTLNPHRDYQFIVSLKGYQTIDEQLNYAVEDNFMEFDKRVVLKKVAK